MASPHRQNQDGPPAKAHPAVKYVIAGVLALLAVLAVWGLLSRHQQAAALRAQTQQAAIPEVTLIKASAQPTTRTVVLPGNVQAYYEAPIYARTNGYVRAWYTDIGTRVKAGQTLAILETPDVRDELRQAQADLQTAIANNNLAQVTARRWIALRATNSVSQQDTDEKIGDAAAKRATVASALANVQRLRQLQDFSRVVAPFDGVVTARLTDIGALITDGTNTILFRVADTSKLRVYTEVPQTYVTGIHEGGMVDLTFAEYPGRSFKARIARTSDALDPTSRTLMVELELDNSQGMLLPGGYTQVHFYAQASGRYARVPVSALLFRADGLHVATLSDRWVEHHPKKQGGDETMGKIALHAVTIGQDYGTALEITTGISPEEEIISDPPDSAADGQVVRVQPSQNSSAKTST